MGDPDVVVMKMPTAEAHPTTGRAVAALRRY
jgi:hypothetical protein